MEGRLNRRKEWHASETCDPSPTPQLVVRIFDEGCALDVWQRCGKLKTPFMTFFVQNWMYRASSLLTQARVLRSSSSFYSYGSGLEMLGHMLVHVYCQKKSIRREEL